MPERSVQGQMNQLRTFLKQKLFKVWAVYFSVAALVFCLLSGIIVYCISVKITQPILELTHRISENIERVQEMKKDTSADAANKRIQF